MIEFYGSALIRTKGSAQATQAWKSKTHHELIIHDHDPEPELEHKLSKDNRNGR